MLRETQKLRARTEELEKRLEIAETRSTPVFQSKSMQEIEELVNSMAPSEANVLITGESGVGKEMVANLIHQRSRRSERPMVKLNCAAFPQTMIEGELFGYVKGAFTGATNDFPGMIAEANGSTLFLDEISDMPADLQTRFLRVLQEREYRPLGSTRTLKADFRVIAATNRPVAQGARRKSAALGSVLPDQHFSDRRAAVARTETGHSAVGRVLRKAIRAATRQSRAGDCAGSVSETARLLMAGKCARITKRNRVCSRPGSPKHDWRERIAEGTAIAGGIATNRRERCRRKAVQSLDDMERVTILQALAQCHGNKKKAAELLGIQRPTLYNKLKRYAIEL